MAGGLLACTRLAAAQVTTATVAGYVKDPTGTPLGRAEVRARDDQHGLSRSVMTDDEGFYRLADLAPSTYEVTAAATGFRPTTRTAVVVLVDSTVRIDFQLALAAVTQGVDVTAAFRPVQTGSGELGTVFERNRIDSLPLNRRDFLQLALLTPGVQGPVDDSELSTRGSFAMHANGGREEFNNFLLDGVDNNDPYVNRYVVQPSVDTIQEFKVATSSYSAEYGRSAAGQVNVITRRGANRLEGFAYEYFRDRSLDAANYFEEGKQPFSRNQFGGGAGGPIVPDRTFFFGDIDLLRANQGLFRLAAVPTAAERLGDLSGLGIPVIDPFTGMPFPGNVIPADRISSIARQMVNLYPQPNQADPAANYLGQPVGNDDETQGTFRVDHALSKSSRLNVRYSFGVVDLFEPYTEGTGTAPGFGDFVTDRTGNLMVEHQQIIGSRATNSLRFGANRFSRDLLTENHDTNVGAAWGVNWLNVPPDAYGYPVINVAGFAGLGDAFTLPLNRETTTFQLADDLAMDRGNHYLKMGGEFRHLRLNGQLDLFTRGSLSFTGAFTGSGIGDLLLGLPTFTIQAQADNPMRMRSNAYAAYLQDDWTLRPDLTVNLGLRYEYISPPVDANNGMSALDPSTGEVVQVGTNGVSRSGMSPDRNNFAPRLGLAWSPSPNVVFRGGYGVFYDSGMFTVNTSQYFNPPQFNLYIFFPSSSGLLTLDDPFPLDRGFVPPPTLSVLSTDLKSSYLQHWNITAQRNLPSFGTVTVAYAGSRGSNLIRPRDLNQPSPGPGDLQARRPYPEFSNIFYIESLGSSKFESLQLTFNRPLSKALSIWAVYTLSKSEDDASAFLGTPADKNFPQDSSNPGAEWGPSSFDVRHRLAVSFIYALPSGNKWTRDTQIQSVSVWHTGQPFTPILQFDNSNTGNSGGSTAGSDRPNLVGDPELDNPTPERWFNTDAFVVAPRYTFGDAGRNSVRGPGFASVDVAVSRRIPISDRTSVTVQLQAFNLFNHTNFDLPEHLVDSPATFGRIFSAKAPRQIQLVARVGF